MDKILNLQVPKLGLTLYPGAIIKLNRFQTETWRLCHGWYEYGENRAVCGWYLLGDSPEHHIRPLQLTDLDDIYLVG